MLRGVLWPLTKRTTTPNSLQSWPCVRKATHLPHGHFFLIVEVLTDTYHTLRSGEIKWTLLPKFYFCSKVFLTEFQLLGDKCHLLPRKFPVKILKYFQSPFPEEARFLLCERVDHLLTRRIFIPL